MVSFRKEVTIEVTSQAYDVLKASKYTIDELINWKRRFLVGGADVIQFLEEKGRELN